MFEAGESLRRDLGGDVRRRGDSDLRRPLPFFEMNEGIKLEQSIAGGSAFSLMSAEIFHDEKR
jgi:hypothetical protein